jgi:hypothetical protein
VEEVEAPLCPRLLHVRLDPQPIRMQASIRRSPRKTKVVEALGKAPQSTLY